MVVNVESSIHGCLVLQIIFSSCGTSSQSADSLFSFGLARLPTVQLRGKGNGKFA